MKKWRKSRLGSRSIPNIRSIDVPVIVDGLRGGDRPCRTYRWLKHVLYICATPWRSQCLDSAHYLQVDTVPMESDTDTPRIVQ
jgi:hypothetical protein